jgi:hypothetical protein
MIRFGFTIRTKSGQRVDNIQIMAATPVDAERRLRQMYQQCVIVERREQAVLIRSEGRDALASDDRVRVQPSVRNSGTQ